MKWYKFRNMSGTYLSPIGWVRYCNKNGWEHLGYAITWWGWRGKLHYPRTRVMKLLGKLLGYKNKFE